MQVQFGFGKRLNETLRHTSIMALTRTYFPLDEKVFCTASKTA